MRATLLATLLVTAAWARGPDEELLARRDIEPTASSIGAFLRTLTPTLKQRQAAAILAAQLGGNPFRRDEATRKLSFAPVAAVGALKDAVRNSDPEVRRRARPLLERMIKLVPTLELMAALRVIHTRRLDGLAREVLDVVPLCFDRYGLHQAERAIYATAQIDDRRILHESLKAATTDTRAVAAIGLAALAHADDTGPLSILLEDDSERVRIVAALAAADRGDRDCIAVFKRLLNADDASVRVRAAHALRHISGRSFDFDAFDDPAARAKTAAAWAQWPAPDTWRTPLPSAPVLRGRTLISIFNKKRVFELDASGAVVWEIRPESAPWVVLGLPNGDRLVAYYQTRSLVRYNARGTEIQHFGGLPGSPTSIDPQPNGNFIVTCGYQNVVLELTWYGKTLWKRTERGKPTDAVRLGSGNMLITLGDGNRVLERDAKGKVIWSLPKLRSPYSARRLANGNTLVCELTGGRVGEWNRLGKLVWSHENLTWLYCAQRLPGGRTLIAVQSGVHAVHPNGETKLIYKTETPGDYVWVCRY